MATVQVERARLEYIERGAGEPVLFVHGSASDCRTWQAQIDALGEGYRTIAYSRRYHWPNRTIAGGADYAMGEHVADLAAVLRSLGAAPAHLAPRTSCTRTMRRPTTGRFSRTCGGASGASSTSDPHRGRRARGGPGRAMP